MENGKYIKNTTNFNKFVCKKFNPHLYDHVLHRSVGCGASALALITGHNPFKIAAKNKNRDHYPDKFLINYLRKNGYKVITINKCNLTNRETVIKYKINSNHILLMSQLFLKKEASWVVSWNDLLFHNFEVSRLDAFGFINCPIVSAYVIYKKSYNRV